MHRPLFALFAVTIACACTRSTSPEPESRGAAAASVAAETSSAAPKASAAAVQDTDTSYRFPAPERIVAIGDLHGDLAATRAALRLAHAIDDRDRWVGGKLTVVQTGDEIDRGADDRAIVELFDRLADAAHAAGGEVRALVGNHEVMNVSGDFRYVTAAGFAAFKDGDTRRVPAAILSQFPVEARGRLAAFFPGGSFALRLSQRNVIAVIGDTLFVHGGVTMDHVRYGLGRLNREISRWMSGQGAEPSPAMAEDGPLWTRRYSDDKGTIDCAGLHETLAALGLRRMVVGHTPHKDGISPACDGQVWRIDTGLSAFYGGPRQVLEIRGDEVTVLR